MIPQMGSYLEEKKRKCDSNVYDYMKKTSCCKT